jgi:hypothetical protein
MNDRPDQHPSDDEEIRALLAADDAVPDAAVDARILAAARAATAAGPPPAAAGRRTRRWPYPVGLGAAAAMLLAVLLVVREFPIPDGDGPEAFAVADRMAEAAAWEFADDAGPVAAPAETAAEGPFQALHRLAILPAPVVVPAAAPVAEPAGCPEPAAALTGEGLLLCITGAGIDIRDLTPGGCAEPLRLARTAGTVTLARDRDGEVAGGEVVVHIDGTPQWRVRCVDGAWQVGAP